ncbi:MAG: hypothetical protein GZ091_15275 [Paludibacter sp.]|nr:hypothetical protein [Paludibacter sp.]
MKRTILFILAITTVLSCLLAQTTKNPFSELGYKKQVMYTSSKGEFEEFHDKADIVEIGYVYFDTKTKKVIGYVDEDKENTEVSTATSAMSVDPLCEKYYWISPYAYCLNNPVKYIDPDGKQVFLGANMPFSPLLGVSDPILLSNKPVATETMARIGRASTESASKTSESTSKVSEISSKGNRTFDGRQSTESNTSKEAFGKAKDANGIPRSQQPDKTIKPNSPEGKEVGLDNRNIKQYEYTNSKGEKVTIRQDKPAQYGDPSGKGNQSEHYNAGKTNENLSKQHHYYLW